MDPIINLDDPVEKTVGRRRTPNPLKVDLRQIPSAKAWRREFGGTGFPKGVYRFRSHEEADEWIWKIRMKQLRARQT